MLRLRRHGQHLDASALAFLPEAKSSWNLAVKLPDRRRLILSFAGSLKGWPAPSRALYRIPLRGVDRYEHDDMDIGVWIDMERRYEMPFQNSKKITAVWSTYENRNAWVNVAGLGWRKIGPYADTSFAAMFATCLAAYSGNRFVNFREEGVGGNIEIHEVYAF
jgi:hypothetical protein